jgi:hypothetical protein
VHGLYGRGFISCVMSKMVINVDRSAASSTSRGPSGFV